VLLRRLQTFLARADERAGPGLPRFVRRERPERTGVVRGRSGAVVVAQRFGSALNLNLHFHALVLDGVYASASPFERPVFHPAEPLTDRDVAWIDYPPKSSPKARSFCRNT